MIGETPPPSLMMSIKKAIDNEIETIVAEEAKLAAERTEKRARGMIEQIATRLATHVSFDHYGVELRIMVRILPKD